MSTPTTPQRKARRLWQAGTCTDCAEGAVLDGTATPDVRRAVAMMHYCLRAAGACDEDCVVCTTTRGEPQAHDREATRALVALDPPNPKTTK